MDWRSYGSYVDPDGETRLVRVPILWVASLPGTGVAPGFLYYQASDNGLYYWNGSAFIGPLGTGGGGGGGAPVGAQYLTLAFDGTLTAERRLVAGAGLQLTDGGANNDATLIVPGTGITRAMLENGAACSVIGRSVNGIGAVADIPAAIDGDVLRRAAGVLGFGAIDQTSVTGLVLALLGKAPTSRLINTTAPIAGGGDLTADRTISLNDDGVTNAKLANMANGTYKARITAGTGDPEDVAFAGASFPVSPVAGQRFFRTDHETLYVWNATRAAWLSAHLHEIPFGETATVSNGVGQPYMREFQIINSIKYGPTRGRLFGFTTVVVGMEVFLSGSATGTLTVTSSGTNVTNGSLSLSAQSFKTDEAMFSNTISANTFIGVRLTSGSLGPNINGRVRLRRIAT